MSARRVINDLHYNGKTVNERLAADGLLGQFEAGAADRDTSRMIALLQQVEIAPRWAAQLATMILEGPSQPPILLRVDDPRNRGVRTLQNELGFPPCMRPVESPRDPYWHLGAHPDIVERLWDKEGRNLPADCRCIVFGTPGLVAPRSGIVLAVAFGTASVHRIPHSAMYEALRGGAKTTQQWSSGRVADLALDYGDDWIFGTSLPQMTSWLLAVYDAVEQSADGRASTPH